MKGNGGRNAAGVVGLSANRFSPLPGQRNGPWRTTASFDQPNDEADHEDGAQDRNPWSAVTAHPASSPHSYIRHVHVSRRGCTDANGSPHFCVRQRTDNDPVRAHSADRTRSLSVSTVSCSNRHYRCRFASSPFDRNQFLETVSAQHESQTKSYEHENLLWPPHEAQHHLCGVTGVAVRAGFRDGECLSP